MPSNTLLFSFGSTKHEVLLSDNTIATAFNVPADRESMWQGREAYDLMKNETIRDALSDVDLRVVDDLVAAIDIAVEKQNESWSKLTTNPRPDSDKYIAVYFTINHSA